MKAVMLSIRPEWCQKIVSCEKTIEVRKTKPKLGTPFKCYVYETKAINHHKILVDLDGSALTVYAKGSGMVIGEFVCNQIDYHCLPYPAYQNELNKHLKKAACVDYRMLHRYVGSDGDFYGWHISDLVIYDKPKELREFFVIDKKAVKECSLRERIYTNPDYTNGVYLPGTYICNKDPVDVDYCRGGCWKKSLVRPPQSWCYVEEVSEE